MRQFDYTVPETLVEALQAKQGATAYKAGGIDLLDRMKEGIERPAGIVGLHRALDRRIESLEDGGVWIGAGVTLAECGASAIVRERFPALADAAGDAATPQVREMATVGGNLLQRPRCWYFRSRHYECTKKGGSTCWAQDGKHESHALFDNDLCAVVHPSNIAPALLAYDARVRAGRLVSRVGTRDLGIDELYTKASADPTTEHALFENEIVTGVTLPAARRGGHSAHYEVRHKQTFDWPLAMAVASLHGPEPRLAVGAVASTPILVEGVGESIRSWAAAPNAAKLAEIAKAAVAGATPLPGNAWRLPLLETAVQRALMKAAGIPEEQW